MTLSASAFALTLSQNAASAAAPAALVSPTVGAAVPFATGTAAGELVSAHVTALTEGALKAMTTIKVKVAALLALTAMLGTGIAWAAGSGDGDPPARGERPAAVPAPAAEGQRDRDRPAAAAPALTGKVVAVAKDGKSFTVESPAAERGAEPSKAVVKIGDKAAVTYNGVGTNGATPTEGYAAQVWFEANSKDVAATVTFTAADGGRRGPDLTGLVTEVGKDGKSVTLEVRRGRGERGAEPKKERFVFDAKTVVSFSNVPKDGATITAGQVAQVWYAYDVRIAGNMIAAKVQFADRAEGRERDEKRPDVAGRVMRTDGKTVVIEVAAGRGEEPTRTTVTIGDKTTAVFNNVPLDGAKAAPGMQVQVWLADGSKDAAAKVFFQGTVPERWPTVTGKVVAVAKDGNSFTVEGPVTVRGEEPKRTEVKLTAKTKLAFFGVGPDGAKVAEGLMAQARLLDGSADTAEQVTFAKAGVPGDRGR